MAVQCAAVRRGDAGRERACARAGVRAGCSGLAHLRAGGRCVQLCATRGVRAAAHNWRCGTLRPQPLLPRAKRCCLYGMRNSTKLGLTPPASQSAPCRTGCKRGHCRQHVVLAEGGEFADVGRFEQARQLGCVEGLVGGHEDGEGDGRLPHRPHHHRQTGRREREHRPRPPLHQWCRPACTPPTAWYAFLTR